MDESQNSAAVSDKKRRKATLTGRKERERRRAKQRLRRSEKHSVTPNGKSNDKQAATDDGK